MQIELTNKQVNKIYDVFRMSPQEYVDLIIPTEPRDPDRVLQICHDYFDITLSRKCREPKYVRARNVTMTLLRELCPNVSQDEIAQKLGMSNSSMVTHAKNRVYHNPISNFHLLKLKRLINATV